MRPRGDAERASRESLERRRGPAHGISLAPSTHNEMMKRPCVHTEPNVPGSPDEVRRITRRGLFATHIRLMTRRAIDRQEWTAFVDAFSRRHDGWLISVSVEHGAGTRRYLTRDTPLRGVVAESNDDTGTMMVFTGDTVPHATHFVERPVSLAVEETAEGAEAKLTITDDSGARTIIEFRSPMRPELVDGVV